MAPAKRRRGSVRLWAYIGLAAFVVADIALVGVAIASVHAAPDARNTVATATDPAADADAPAESSATPAPTAQATTQPTPATTAAAFTLPTLGVLSALDARTAWSATPGKCGGADAVISLTTDAGRTYKAKSTAKVAIHEVLSIRAVSAKTAFVVAKAGPDCAVGFFRTFTAGTAWELHNDDLGAQSYFDPADAGELVVSGSAQPSPCVAPATTRQYSHGTSVDAVLCAGATPADSTVATRASGAASWTTKPVPNVAALTVTGSSVALALGGQSCPSLATATLANPDISACGTAPSFPATTAMAFTPSSLWLQQDATTEQVAASAQ